MRITGIKDERNFMKFAIMPLIPIFPIEYYVLAILFAIVFLGYFLLKKENRRLKVVGGIIIVGLILSILLFGFGNWLLYDLS